MKKYLLPLLLVLAIAACDQRERKKTEADEAAAGATAGQPTVDDEKPAVRPEELIWVFEARGSRQCEGGGTTLEESSGKLTGNGVEVQESHCAARTDRMYPSVCGGATGDILLHLVSKKSLDTALELGFDPADQIQYERGSCPDNRA
ncbi:MULTISPECIES: hypothetical protein [unclassified Microbulbifer]|uniref:hypothetical protein n=1 Tax=unclassified Microbulbifer TaxID=2619833 RepID=UPI0027E50CAD|nr:MULTISPECIES: hypothetical protein [unclassified Microbulbifer]